MWLSAIGGGVFLFAVLFWVVRRADRIMRRQEAELVESERLGVAVEMASAVAHSLRNPLASIRGAAQELEGSFTGSDLVRVAREVGVVLRWVTVD